MFTFQASLLGLSYYRVVVIQKLDNLFEREKQQQQQQQQQQQKAVQNKANNNY